MRNVARGEGIFFRECIMKQEKFIFIDRDGTLIVEPEDKQIDSIEKLEFLPGVFTALSLLRQAGYKLVMISNQDGLGTKSFPRDDFQKPQDRMLKVFQSQGITFDDVRICPDLPNAGCDCRKPKIGLLLDYLTDQRIDKNNSYVIGDRETDLEFAKNIGLPGIQIGAKNTNSWSEVTRIILEKPRKALIKRETSETNITIAIDLDKEGDINIETGMGFFDHMLEQIVKHAGISATIAIKGDLEIDDHHTVEDTAIALGSAIKEALGDKRGIERYGFLLPMDEAKAVIALDLSGRSFCKFQCEFNRDQVGGLSTEMISHFFRSFSDGLQATLHIEVLGENTHHMCEAAFKGVGRALGQAIVKNNRSIPSTKGIL